MTIESESEPVLLDTNVLVYAIDEDSPHHGPSRAVLERAANGEGVYCLSSQILAEFFAVITNPRRVKSPRAAVEAVEIIEAFPAMPGITLLATGPETAPRLLSMVRAAPVTGAKVFDLQLAATALEAGVSNIHTFNTAHFERIAGMRVVAL